MTFLLVMFLNLLVMMNCDCPYLTTINDRRSDKNVLRIMQYNAEWLFVDYYANMDCPGNGCTWHTKSDAEKHLNYVSEIINKLNPDIINVCEVEGCDELNMLKNSTMLTNSAKYVSYLKKGTDTGTGQNVGMLTKIDPIIDLYRTEERVNYPIPGSQCGYTGVPSTTGVSKHYITEFLFEDVKIALIGVHLLAIPTDSARCAQREGQAQVIQNVVSSYVSKGYEIILLGDMNDYDNDVLDINSNKPISKVLDILKGKYGDKINSYKLTNIASKISKNNRYSDWWDSDMNCSTNSIKDLSMIDHVLVSDGIKNAIINVFIYHGYKEYCGKWNSDHWPVIIDLKLNLLKN
jgi:exonuclease III